MAHSKEKWDLARTYFEAGKHSPQEISDLVGIERSAIVKKAKNHNWQSGANADYIEARVLVAEKKSQLNSQIINVLDNIADDKIRRSGLVFGGLESLAKLAKTSIEKNQTVDKLNCGDGIQNFEPRELNTADYKNLSTTLTDIGKAFGLIETQSAIKIDNNNAIQNNTEIKRVTIARRSDRVE